MSMILKGLELNYPVLEKQEYEIWKVIKYFRPYLLKNDCIIFMLHPTIRSVLVQQELDETQVN